MDQPLIMINTYAIRDGKKDEFLARFREMVEVVRAEEPRMLYFAEHLSDDGTEGSTVQIHADADNVEYHMQIVGDRIQELVRYLDFTSVQIYGAPPQEFVDQMHQIAGPNVTVRRLAAGFSRFLS